MTWEMRIRQWAHRHLPLRLLSGRVSRCRCAGACRCAGVQPFLLYRAIELEAEFYRESY